MSADYRGIGTAVGGSSATILVPPPAGVTAGDILLMALFSNSSTSLPTPPGDWSLVDQEIGGAFNVRVYQKIATASEPANYTVTRGGSESYAGVVLGFYSTVLNEMYVDAHANQANASSTNRTCPGVITTKDSAGLACIFAGSSNNTSTPPGDMTERLDALVGLNRPYVMTAILTAAGATGAKVATGTAMSTRCVTIAVAERLYPDSPAPLIATSVSPSQINLSWTDVDDETGYSLERSNDGVSGWAVIATPTANTTNHSDSGLGEYTLRYYRIRAQNSDGFGEYSNVANARTHIIAPTDLTATGNGPNQIDLAWSDNSGVETGYQVEKSADGLGGWSLLDTTAANATSYSDTSLSPAETAYYRVRAVAGSDTSAYSNIDGAATDDEVQESHVTLAGALAELEAELSAKVTLFGVLAEIGIDTTSVTLFGVLVELEEAKPMPTYFPLPVEWSHTHVALPEPVTGYQLDAGGSFWSVVVPTPASNLMRSPSFEHTLGASNLFIVNFSPAEVRYNKASRGFGSLYLTPIPGVEGRVSYFFRPQGPAYYLWAFDLYHTAGQEFRLEIWDEDETVLFASATLNARYTGWGRYKLLYYEKVSPPVSRFVRLSFTSNNVNLAPVYTDGWLITESKDEDVTYFDGDMVDESYAADPYAFGWVGDAHHSVSVRSGRNFAAGVIRSFYDLGFMTTGIVGLGLGDPIPDVVLLSEGVDILRGNRIEEREFSIIGSIMGNNVYELQQKRNQLIAFLNTLNSSSGALMLLYQAVNGSGYPLGKRLWLPVAFLGGLSGQYDNLYQETLELRFRLLGAKLYEEFGESKELAMSPEPTATTLIYARDPRTGQWDTFGDDATLGGTMNCVLTLSDGKVVVGGNFTSIGGVTARRIALFDPETRSWSEIGNGFNGQVKALAIGKGLYNNQLIAVGDFTADGDEAGMLRRVVRWNGETWFEINNGVTGAVNDVLVYPDGRIFIAGTYEFTTGSGQPLHGFAYNDARIDGDGSWHDLLSSMTIGAFVSRLILAPDLKIYLGGNFDELNSDPNFGGVARYDPYLEFFPFEAYENLAKGLNGDVHDIALGPDGYLYAVGNFGFTVSGALARKFARFNGVSWEEVGNGEIAEDIFHRVVIDKRGVAYVITDPHKDGPESFPWPTSYFGWNGSAWFPLDFRSNPFSLNPNGIPHLTTDGRIFLPIEIGSETVLPAYTKVTYTGTADAPIKLQVTGPVAMIRLSNWTTNQHVYFKPLELMSGEKLTLDLTGIEARAFTNLRSNVLSQLVSGASDLTNFRLIPGDNHITLLTIGVPDENTKAVLAWRNHHWSIDQGLAEL